MGAGLEEKERKKERKKRAKTARWTRTTEDRKMAENCQLDKFVLGFVFLFCFVFFSIFPFFFPFAKQDGRSQASEYIIQRL